MLWYEKLRFARKVKGLSLVEAADKVAMSQSYICEIESGRVKDPSFFKIMRLLEIYNLDAKDMLPFITTTTA